MRGSVPWSRHSAAKIEALNVKIGAVESTLQRKIEALNAVKIDAVESTLSTKIAAVESALGAKIRCSRVNARRKDRIYRVGSRRKMIETLEARKSKQSIQRPGAYQACANYELKSGV